MQTLVYHPKWEKTLSKQDRLLIEKIFKQTSSYVTSLSTTMIRVAKNYKDDLLVTVMIHNPQEQPFYFQNQCISYIEDFTCLATQAFTIDSLVIPPHTSMPWTFIFTKNSLEKEPTLHGTINIHKNLRH
ncbi:hypothetical protein BTS2_0133 [Bacillus sp. TS-2]|nr:hypothetical protein BTS2_0133 [Bacillus sp. TS-2]